MNVGQRVVVVAGGALAGVALLGGVALAQTPAPTPAAPTATATAQPGEPTPRPDHDCPEKDGASGSSTSNTRGGQRVVGSRT